MATSLGAVSVFPSIWLLLGWGMSALNPCRWLEFFVNASLLVRDFSYLSGTLSQEYMLHYRNYLNSSVRMYPNGLIYLVSKILLYLPGHWQHWLGPIQICHVSIPGNPRNSRKAQTWPVVFPITVTHIRAHSSLPCFVTCPRKHSWVRLCPCVSSIAYKSIYHWATGLDSVSRSCASWTSGDNNRRMQPSK